MTRMSTARTRQPEPSLVQPDANDAVINDNLPIQCLLEMDSNGDIVVVVQPGCSVADVHDMLRELALCGGRFERLTIVDEFEAGSTA